MHIFLMAQIFQKRNIWSGSYMMHSVISRPIHIVDRIRNDYGIEKDTEEERGKMKKGCVAVTI
mgnify:CR=1 FL=1